MKYFDHKILVILTLAFVYFFESKSDSITLAQLNTDLNSLANYSEIIEAHKPITPLEPIQPILKPQKEEYIGITWDEWYKKCKALPFYRIIGTNYTNKAIEWNELENAINKFIEVNTEILTKKEKWLYDAPSASDPFFTTKNQPLNPIQPFVQKLIVKPGTKIGFHGDFHGDVHSMVEYIQSLNKDKYLDGFKIIDPNFYLVFLGDYEDRGNYGAEVWYSLMRLKIANPNNVIITRGNHEDPSIAAMYGFMAECNKFKNYDPDAFMKIARIFDFLPPALYLGSGTNRLINYLMCVHGGIEDTFNSQNILSSPHALAFEWLRFSPNNEFPSNFSDIGFMWSDFQLSATAPTKPSGRGAGIIAGKEFTKDFLQQHSNPPNYFLKGIFRAHQHGVHDLMYAMIKGKGVAKIWSDDANKGKDLWDNIICTFLVGPDTPYGKQLDYNFDGFAILTTAEKFEDWKFEIKQNENVVPVNL